MKEIQYSVTILGSMRVPENATNEEIKSFILDDYWSNEPNDVEWKETDND